VNRVLLILLDGVGAGAPDPETNPCAGPGLRFLGNLRDDPVGKPLPRGGRYVPVDACLGVEGLPQSATGQTTIFTGVNAAAELGRHLPGFPNARLKEILAERSILKRAADAGRRTAFLNAYRPRFFELGEAIWRHPMSATSWANRSSGRPFATLEDLREGRAVYHDITGADLVARGFDVSPRRPEESGLVVARRMAELDLGLFEFFRTDLAGHARDLAFAREEIAVFELFLESALAALDLERTLVLVVSDHGNVEDLTFRGHTRAAAQCLVFGAGAEAVAGRLRSLVDVVPVVAETLALA
jgi:2,3-bisphosphoglycerate-independent phosphoglycerate mutase